MTVEEMQRSMAAAARCGISAAEAMRRLAANAAALRAASLRLPWRDRRRS